METPLKSIIITSKNTSFESKEVGSWQVKKSGKWISKGRARVVFDVDTILMTENKSTDIIMVLDISGSMSGDKLDRVKQDSMELVDSLLSNGNNQVALITFDTTSTIVSDFTSDKDKLISQINDLQVQGSTNYYQALVNVDNILGLSNLYIIFKTSKTKLIIKLDKNQEAWVPPEITKDAGTVKIGIIASDLNERIYFTNTVNGTINNNYLGSIDWLVPNAFNTTANLLTSDNYYFVSMDDYIINTKE